MTLTTAQKTVKIRIQADPDGSGTTREHLFEASAGGGSGLQVSHQLQNQQAIQNAFTRFQSIISNFVDSGESPNKGIFVDLGDGLFVTTLQFQNWEGAVDADGNALQWGDTGNSSQLTETDATGEDPITQMQIFSNVLRKSQIGSIPDVGGAFGEQQTATLEFGQYSDSGVLEPLDVVFRDPQVDFSGGDPSVYTGQIECIEAADLNRALDSQESLP